LALQRTILANQSTFLAFLRTSMYFFVAGLSLESLLKIENSFIIEWFLFISSLVIFCIGVFNYFKHKKMILDNEKHIGDYKMQYDEQ
jgi:putative membrane protein